MIYLFICFCTLPATCFTCLMWWDNLKLIATWKTHCWILTSKELGSMVVYAVYVIFSSPLSLFFSGSPSFFLFLLPGAMQWPSLAVQTVYKHHPERNNDCMESRENMGSKSVHVKIHVHRWIKMSPCKCFAGAEAHVYALSNASTRRKTSRLPQSHILYTPLCISAWLPV